MVQDFGVYNAEVPMSENVLFSSKTWHVDSCNCIFQYLMESNVTSRETSARGTVEGTH